ncbi:glycosyltransferase family 2 protein [Clostridium tyrobutyricum]|uniref:glycosyltransferase family 2 protein n=1 Tax=Clostridium tyrobutyricum TaxID=1519 RepID=UPI001C38F063|nr:glycosyltransferase family 2 protein [Clostridium tyrobutyricum]MBV4425516.1 glycosyltransferase family 2 protein [Clostridium tyrobutyricum]
MSNKIAAVVVTYNRKECLIKNIKCLLNQTKKIDRIYIIDNASTDGTRKFISDYIDNNIIKYIYLEENIGGSGGFYTGIKEAYNDGFDFIWGMDDDAYADKNALKFLEEIRRKINENICLCSNCDNDREFYDEYKLVDCWMFVGFYISRTIIKKVGFPRKDFFIYHDDSEYAYRIIKNNYKIYKVKNSIINHGNFNSREKYSKKLLNKIIELPKMSNWKMYYYVRNGILKYKYNDKNKYRQVFIYLPKFFIKLVILNRKQINIFIKAYFHGIFGVSGKVMTP